MAQTAGINQFAEGFIMESRGTGTGSYTLCPAQQPCEYPHSDRPVRRGARRVNRSSRMFSATFSAAVPNRRCWGQPLLPLGQEIGPCGGQPITTAPIRSQRRHHHASSVTAYLDGR